MRIALQLAAQGAGHVEPNPMVGCVIVAQEQMIGQGYHQQYGQAHAERNALRHVAELGKAAELSQATAYVTLEPCCHHGKTPPCTEALIEAGINRVVIAMLDPFEQVSGQGVEQLRTAGIAVSVGVEELAARELNAPYLKRLQQQRPWVIAKWAMTLDGKIATHTGDSQWISGVESRAEVHRLRGSVDAILVGRGTAVTDNPRLTARGDTPPIRRALRVVADSDLQIALTSHLVETARELPTLLWAGPTAPIKKVAQLRSAGCIVQVCQEPSRAARLDALLRFLVTDHHVTNLLVEGGGGLLGSLLELQQIDQCEVYVAPKLIGGATAPSPIAGLGLAMLSDGPHSSSVRVTPSGPDTHISCRFSWE